MKTIDQILEALPNSCQELCRQEPLCLRKLTSGTVRKLFKPINGQYPGIYLFSTILDNVPAYVGMSGKLDVRVGADHRSVDSIAQLTRKLKDKHSLSSMSDAREILYREYQVRMLIVEDAGLRSMLEIYTAIKLSTPFNVIE